MKFHQSYSDLCTFIIIAVVFVCHYPTTPLRCRKQVNHRANLLHSL